MEAAVFARDAILLDALGPVCGASAAVLAAVGAPLECGQCVTAVVASPSARVEDTFAAPSLPAGPLD